MNEITIYKIYCKNESIKDIYIGSTSYFKKRKKSHKSCCNNSNGSRYNNYNYVFIRENGGWNNWIMESITTCSKEERYKMERWHIENIENTNLNKYMPCRTEEEYYKINKEYREKNKEAKKENNRQYYKDNKEKIKEEAKQYYYKNKDKFNNKEKMKERKEKITCECGATFRKDNKIRHNKSNKHQNYLKLNE